MEELLGEVSSLASVYHKPAETFIGHGRIGADSVQRKGAESVCSFCMPSSSLTAVCRLSDDRFTAQKALQTVVAGQQAENLLDFDDGPTQEGQPSGLAATQILPSSTAAANLLSGTSTNPLDDLVSIFGGMSASGVGGGGNAGTDVFGGLGSVSPPGGNFIASPLESVASPTIGTSKPQEDLLGLF